MPTDPNEDFCRKLCEEFDLMFTDGIRPHPKAMSAISKAIQTAPTTKLLRQKINYIARLINRQCGNPEGTPCDDQHPRRICEGHKWLKKVRSSIRSLQLSAEDVVPK